MFGHLAEAVTALAAARTTFEISRWTGVEAFIGFAHICLAAGACQAFTQANSLSAKMQELPCRRNHVLFPFEAMARSPPGGRKLL